jgi:plasmid stabilization system protein ParE
MSGFSFHPEAVSDLDDIWDYIAADSVDAADRVLREIYEGLRRLASLPRLGHKRTELTSRPLRFYNVGEYVIAYAPDEKPLLVIAILHGRRNPRLLAALLRERE